MDLQSFAPGMRRYAVGLAAAVLALCAPLSSAWAVDNVGLGPLTIRNQFPITLGFLTYEPDAPGLLPAGTLQVRYQFELTNSFVNTQSPRANNGPVITRTQVDAGLTLADFPATGYGVYLDVETQRHQLRVDYALADSLELGVQMAWLTMGGGFLDSRIEAVEKLFGGLNKDRTFSDQNRFDFYVARNGRFLQAYDQPFTNVPQDPVVSLKWNWGEGGAVLPALTIKGAYKVPLDRNPTGERALTSSGGADWGVYALLSKAVGNVVGHFQFGVTRLDVKPDTYASHLRHRMFGLEFRATERSSVLLQSVTQSSIFLRNDNPSTMDFDLSRPTDVMALGYKYASPNALFQIGFLEDYNQQRNEADITGFLEWGGRW